MKNKIFWYKTNISLESISNKDIIRDNNYFNELLNKKDNEINNQKDIDDLILNECKKDKKILSVQSAFIKNFKKLYKDSKIKVKEYHLQYLYRKYKKLYFPQTMDEIFEYSKDIDDLGLFCRDIAIKIIYNKNKELFTHRHMIFYW